MGKAKPRSRPPKNARRLPAEDLQQKALPGAENGNENPKVEAAAMDHLNRLADKLDANKAAKDSMAKLLQVMADEGVQKYDHSKLHVRLKDTRVAKVKMDKDKAPKKPRKPKKKSMILP